VLASGAPFSQSIWERIDARLASYAGEIQASATQACEDAQQQHTSITLTDRRLACLHAREVDLDAYVESLATGDQTAVAHAIQGLEALTPVASCATEVLIGERVVPPANATLAADVASLRTDLARIKAMSYAGRGQEVAPLADSALARAKSLGYQPVIAEAHLRRAHLAESRQEFERAEPDYQQAWWAAVKSAEDVVAREAANHLASMFSGDPKRFHEARTWSDNAEAVAKRRGIDDAHRVTRLRTLARIAEGQGNDQHAVNRLQAATQAAEGAFGPDAWKTATIFNDLSDAQLRLGDLEGAVRASQRALASGRAALGGEHPDLAGIYRQRAKIFTTEGNEQAAEVASRRAAKLESPPA